MLTIDIVSSATTGQQIGVEIFLDDRYYHIAFDRAGIHNGEYIGENLIKSPLFAKTPLFAHPTDQSISIAIGRFIISDILPSRTFWFLCGVVIGAVMISLGN